MVSQGFGHIVNISSVAGKFGVPVRTSYCAAKHAIIGMMDSLRLEVCMVVHGYTGAYVTMFAYMNATPTMTTLLKKTVSCFAYYV